MPGRRRPANSGPAERNTDRSSRTETALSSSRVRLAEDCSLDEGHTHGAAGASLAARRAASFDVRPAFRRMRALWGAVSVEISVEMLWTST